jgi:hypothetical protein
MSIRKNSFARLALASLLVVGMSFGGASLALAQTVTAAAAHIPAPAAAAQTPALVELTAANANDLLVGLQGKTFIVAYSSKESSAAQTQQLALITREAANYAGRLAFVRLDVDKYPEVFAALYSNRKWDHGPYFFIVSNNPNFRATISDTFNGTSDPVHSIGSVRLHAEINDYLKLQPTP